MTSNFTNEIFSKNSFKSKMQKGTPQKKKPEKLFQQYETQDHINKDMFDDICGKFSEEMEIVEKRNGKNEFYLSNYLSSESYNPIKINNIKDKYISDLLQNKNNNFCEYTSFCSTGFSIDQQKKENLFNQTSENLEKVNHNNFIKNFNSINSSLPSGYLNFNLTVAGLLLDFSKMIKHEGSRPYSLINYIISNMYSCNGMSISLSPASKKILDKIKIKINSNKFNCQDKLVMDLNLNVVFKNIQAYSQMDLSNSTFFNLFEKINNLFCEKSIYMYKKNGSLNSKNFRVLKEFEFDSKNWKDIETVCFFKEDSKNCNLGTQINSKSKDCFFKERFSYQSFVVKDLKKKLQNTNNFHEYRFKDINIYKNLHSLENPKILFNLLKDRKLFLSLIYLANRINKNVYTKNLISPCIEPAICDKLSSIFSCTLTSRELIKNIKFKNSNLLANVDDNLEVLYNLLAIPVFDDSLTLLNHKIKKCKILKVLKFFMKFEEMPKEIEGDTKNKLYKKLWIIFNIFLKIKLFQNNDTKIGSSLSDCSYFLKILVEFIKTKKDYKVGENFVLSQKKQLNCSNRHKLKFDGEKSKKFKNLNKFSINKDIEYNCIMKKKNNNLFQKNDNIKDETTPYNNTRSDNLYRHRNNINIIKIDKCTFEDVDLVFKNDENLKNKNSTNCKDSVIHIHKLDSSTLKDPLTQGVSRINDFIKNSINKFNNFETVKNFNVNLNLNLNINLSSHTKPLNIKTKIKNQNSSNELFDSHNKLKNLNLIKRKRCRSKISKDSNLNYEKFYSFSNDHLDQQISQLENMKSNNEKNKVSEKLRELKSINEKLESNKNSIIKNNFSNHSQIHNFNSQLSYSNLCINNVNKLTQNIREKNLYKNILAASKLPQNDSFKMVNLPHENPEKFYGLCLNSKIPQISQILSSSQLINNNLNNNFNMKNILENGVDDDKTITTESDESHFYQPQALKQIKKNIHTDLEIPNKYVINKQSDNFEKVRQDSLSSFSSSFTPPKGISTVNNSQFENEKNSNGVTENFLNKINYSLLRSGNCKKNNIFFVTKLRRDSKHKINTQFSNDLTGFNELNEIKSTISNSLSLQQIKNLKKNLTSKKYSNNIELMALEKEENEFNMPYYLNPLNIQNFNGIISDHSPIKKSDNLYISKEIISNNVLDPFLYKNDKIFKYDINGNFNYNNHLDPSNCTNELSNKNVHMSSLNNISLKNSNFDLKNKESLKQFSKFESYISQTENKLNKINRYLRELQPVNNVNFEIMKCDKKTNDHFNGETYGNPELGLFNDYKDEASHYFDL